jgi:hypothetical protein
LVLGVQVGSFIKKFNNFTRDYFSDGPWVDFSLCKGGTWGVLLMFGDGKKWSNFIATPSFGWEW